MAQKTRSFFNLSDVLDLPKQKHNKSSDHCFVCHSSKQKHLPFKSSALESIHQVFSTNDFFVHEIAEQSASL